MDVTLNYYPYGKTKAITMSYDDGRIYDKLLLDIFNQYGVKGTFHLNSAKIGMEGYITEDDISKLYVGHEVALHTHTHPSIAYTPNERMIGEVIDNRKQLEKLTGYVINGMSYPMNSFDENVIRKFCECGIVYSRTTYATGGFMLPENFMRWNPTVHHSRGVEKWNPILQHSHTVLMEKAKEFLEYPDFAKNMPLLYVWGHSYEFENDHTWDVIENFCKYVSDAKDVWFATNIEIYNYITAMRNLRFSADCMLVYNPSAICVWIGVNGQPVAIESGKTLRLV